MSSKSSKTFYKITLLNWREHNPGKKNTYKKTLIANNLISDAKLLSLPVSHRWLFINLLLIAGDYASDTITLTEQQLNATLSSRVRCKDVLDLMQSLQLLTFEKNPLLKERKKEIIKEEELKKFDDNFLKIEDPKTEIREPEISKPKFITPKLSPTNSTAAFDARFTKKNFYEILELWEIATPTFKNNLHLVEDRFKETSALEAWLDHLVTRKGYQAAKKESKVSSDNYLAKALRSEIGMQ